MCLVLDLFLWGHSSRVCDISCFIIYLHIFDNICGIMNAHVLLNLFNKLEKRDKMQGLQNILLLFAPS